MLVLAYGGLAVASSNRNRVMAYTPRPDSEVIAELEAIREGYKNQRKAAVTDSNSPIRVGNAIEHCRASIARLEKEIADLEHRRDHAPDIIEHCDTRIAEINLQIEGIKRKGEKDKFMETLKALGLVPNG